MEHLSHTWLSVPMVYLHPLPIKMFTSSYEEKLGKRDQAEKVEERFDSSLQRQKKCWKEDDQLFSMFSGIEEEVMDSTAAREIGIDFRKTF